MDDPVREAVTRTPARRWRGPVLTTVLGVAVLAALFWSYRRTAGTAVPPVTRELAVFDSYARLTLWATPEVAEPALSECARRLADLHTALNRWEPTGELARLNAAAGQEPFVCSDTLWDALQAARRAYRQTGGAFDISVGPIMAVWGFHRKRDTLPADADVQEALTRVGLDKVEFAEERHAVRFSAAGMGLDLGGIAKGYALDVVTAILARHRIDRYLVDLGGNVACTALPPPGRQEFFIGIRNPFALEDLLGRMPIRGRAVSTSGNYERRIIIQGKEIGHIVDPRTGRPVSGPAGVTAVTPVGTDSDVFSTAVYVAGRPLAEELARTVPGTGFVLVSGTPEAPRLEVVGEVRVLDLPPSAVTPMATPSP